MKRFTKIFIIVVFSLSVFSAYTQTGQGNWLMGAKSSIGFASLNMKYKAEPKGASSNEYDGPSIFGFEFVPSFGYFVATNFALGLDFGYSYAKVKQDKNDVLSAFESTSNSISVGPFAAIFFGDGNVKPFLSVGAGIGSAKSTYEDDANAKSDEDETTYSLFYWEATGGVALFLNDHISLNAGIGYGFEQDTYEDTPETGDNYYETVSGIEVFLGFSLYLGNN